MKVCIPSKRPGGPDSIIPGHFNEMEIIDYYEVRPDGGFDHMAQSAYCGGGCFDIVEAMIRRGIEALVVNGITASTLNRFRSEGVKVLRADDQVVRTLLDAVAAGRLKALNPKQASSSQSKTKGNRRGFQGVGRSTELPASPCSPGSPCRACP